MFTPSGRCVHARGRARSRDVRQALRERVKRATTGVEAGGAQDFWRGLTAGEWSICRRVDVDGRRLFVAVRNSDAGASLRALTPREHQVATLAAQGLPLKHVAYDLKIATGTVKHHLSWALRKLGLRSRLDLVTLHGQLVRSNEL